MRPRLSGYACILVVDEVAGDRIMMVSDDKDQITIAALLATLGPPAGAMAARGHSRAVGQ